MSSTWIFSFFSLLLIWAALVEFSEVRFAHANLQGSDKISEEEEMVPMIEEGKIEKMVFNESRRKLGSFQICALCTCCGGAKGLCLPSPCCYAINCNIPNRPFGFCSFTPKTCNCFGCHI
ncbi:hypothetical protein RJ641_020367 [Dillenia turbinata]|uniref:DUF7866 domain-containing protein n=1 Tax=Dillenia turbinata TaxID=194707 RepID=A0AAN8UGU8_9MAGN